MKDKTLLIGGAVVLGLLVLRTRPAAAATATSGPVNIQPAAPWVPKSLRAGEPNYSGRTNTTAQTLPAAFGTPYDYSDVNGFV